MNIVKKTFTMLVLAVVIGAGYFGLNYEASAQTQNCDIAVNKSADPAINTVFIYTVISGEIEFQVPLQDPDSDHFATGIPSGDSVTITEEPLPGWELVDIQCIATSGVDYSTEGSTLTINCLDDPGDITCTFTNVLLETQVPTLSEWGLIAMAGILGIVGLMVVRRRKATA